MNAIVGLCHFCEAHGPRPVFCTFTTDDETHTTEAANSSPQCTGCKSLGSEIVLVSKDDDGTIYCSRESVPNTDVTAFLRQAAIRSITCEVSWSKEGGVVYFSETHGHVLSLTFQLKDTRARGLKRWFSIVVLMKDKMLLLNITPLLSEHMQNIAKELQEYAENVYDAEQKVCSQRALRLNTGCNYFGQSRSLITLSGEENIFKKLHNQFMWMLKAGALTYTETLYTSQDLLDKITPKEVKGVTIFSQNVCSVLSEDECMPLRALQNLLGKTVFKIILYCTLSGINIVIKTNQTPSVEIVKALARLLPVTNIECIPNIRIHDFSEHTPTASKCILQELEDNIFACRWPGVVPGKCPTLMCRIENAMDNPKFDNPVLHQHVKSLQLEWLGIAKAIKSAVESSSAKSEPVIKLKQVFGVTPQDDYLINYWISAFCT